MTMEGYLKDCVAVKSTEECMENQDIRQTMILILDVWMVLCGWIYQLHNPIKSAVTLDIYLSKEKEKLWCMINWFNFIVNSCHKSTRQNQYSLRKIKHKSCHTKQSKQKQTMEICGTKEQI